MECSRSVSVGSLNPSAWNPVTIALALTLLISCSPHKFVCYLITFTFLYVPLVVTPAEVKQFISKMEPRATELVVALKNSNLSVDTKVGHLLGIKSDIKQKNVPEGAVPPIFESVRLAISSQHSSLSGAGFSTLGHLLKRLFIQEQHHLVSMQSRILYPLLVERLGDHRERIRAQAAQAFTDLWLAASEEVEQYVLEQALVGKNPRAKEMSMIWLSNMTKNYGLLFRSYVPSLVACLEDADSAVRNTAKSTVIELFENVPERAKSDLKRQMAAHNVRKSFVNAILAGIGLGSTDADFTSRPASRADGLVHRPMSRAEIQPSRSMSRLGSAPLRPVSRVEHTHSSVSQESVPSRPASVLSSHSESYREFSRETAEPERPKSRLAPASHSAPVDVVSLPQPSRPSSQEGEKVEPLFMSSARQVDELVRDLLPYFEGRESEDNWLRREKGVLTLRRLTHGNAPDDYASAYFTGMKSMLDGIFKVVNSLRTTLSTNGCLLIQDFARRCGPRIDPMLEIMMQNLIKLCGGMKKISAQNGNATVDAVIENATFTTRILQHVTSACQDKNVQLRLYAAGWLKTLIQKQSRHKSSIEHGGGLDMIDKSLKKCLGDANPGVREVIRGTFWMFYRVWPDRANDILSNLDNKSRSLLEKDPSNPNADRTAMKTTAPSRKGAASGSSTIAGRSALKEAIAAQKRARLAPAKATPPPRPESAQSGLSDKHSSSNPLSKSSVRTVPTGAALSSLSSAPMRPAAKPRRPELNRPATADPYAGRRTAAADPSLRQSNRIDGSPSASKSKASTPSSKSISSTGSSRNRADPAGTTRDRPKRLVLPKTRAPDSHSKPPMKPTKTHSRNNSNESMPVHSPRSEFSPAIASPRSPVFAQLGSPLGPPAQFSQEQDMVDDIVDSTPQTISSAEQLRYIPSHDAVVESSGSVQRPKDSREFTKSEPVAIYEDATPSKPSHEERGNSSTTVLIENKPPNSTPKPSKADTNSPIVVNNRVSTQDDLVPHLTGGLGFLTEAGPVVVEASELSHSIAETSKGPFTHASLSVNQQPDPVTDPSKPAESLSSSLPTGSPPVNNNENNAFFGTKSPNISLVNRSPPKHNVLEELPSNEPGHRDNKLRQSVAGKPGDEAMTPAEDPSRRRWKKVETTERRRSISPRSKDPNKAREMLDKGIHRIRAKTMDILGYRKLQGLIRYHESIFTDEEKYDEMLLALFDELESPPDDKRQLLGRPLDLKTQVLLTIRFMFIHNKLYFSAYYPKALSALVMARKYYDGSCHIVSGLEETADDIINVCEPSEVIDPVLDVIIMGEKDEKDYRSILMGVSVLTRVIGRLNSRKDGTFETPLERLGEFAANQLTDRQPDVRRLTVQLCVQLHKMVGDDEDFWRILGNPRENSRNLLTYYIFKN